MEIEITIPTEQKEKTLGQYIEFIKFQENNDDNLALRVKALEIFCGLKQDDVYKVPYNEVIAISDIIYSSLNTEQKELIQTFKVGEKEFGFIPDLEGISFGEYVDVDTCLQDVENFGKAMAVLYRPITRKIGDLYEIEDYEPSKYDMNNMPLDAALSAIFFLFNLGMELSKATMTYFQVEEMEAVLENHLQSNQDGIHQFTNSLKEILQRLNISLN